MYIKSLILLFILILGDNLYSQNSEKSEEYSLKLESIRYKYDILGEKLKAKVQLENLIRQTNDKDILSQAYFFLGSIFDQAHLVDSASYFYRQALKEPQLLRSNTDWLYRRLAQINPELVKAISLETGDIRKVFKVLPFNMEGNLEHILQVNQKQNVSNFYRRFIHVDSKGLLSEFPVKISSSDKLWDIQQRNLLISGNNSVKIISPQTTLNISVSNTSNLQDASFIPNSKNSFILQFQNSIAYFKDNVLWHTIKYNGKDCMWENKNQNSTGLLFCQDKGVHDINLKLGSLEKLASLTDKPYYVKLFSDKVLIQYLEYFEVRSSVNFQNVLWNHTSSLSDKLYFNASSVYLLDNKGTMKSFNLVTGQVQWEKALDIKEIYATDDELYVISHAQACFGLDLAGNINWTYEFGWDSNVAPVFGKDFMLLLYQNGRRIHLNLDLIQISKSSNEKRITNQLTAKGNKDWKAQLQYANKILETEPGNGMVWKYKYMCLKNLGRSANEQFYALIQAARSLYSPTWKNSSTINTLNKAIGSQWIWKRSYGQKYFPNLIPTKKYMIYLENNNQTLMMIDATSGELYRTIHVPEELDSKLLYWVDNKIIASSSSKLYLIPTTENSSSTETLNLKKPICKSVLLGDVLYFSDWFGNLHKINLSQGLKAGFQWKKKLSDNGLLLHYSSVHQKLNVVDIKGKYYSVSLDKGKSQQSLDLPEGTITDIHAQSDQLFIGYDDGRLLAVEPVQNKVSWNRSFPNQIFSLSGNGHNILVITTSNKKLYCLNSDNGGVRNVIDIATSLINKPVLTRDGYWLGTTFPSLEKRNFNHKVLRRYVLTDKPGNPVLHHSSVFLSTLDGFIFAFSP